MKDGNPRAIRRGRDQSEKCDRRLLSAAVFVHDVREYAFLMSLSTQWPECRLATVLSPTQVCAYRANDERLVRCEYCDSDGPSDGDSPRPDASPAPGYDALAFRIVGDR